MWCIINHPASNCTRLLSETARISGRACRSPHNPVVLTACNTVVGCGRPMKEILEKRDGFERTMVVLIEQRQLQEWYDTKTAAEILGKSAFCDFWEHEGVDPVRLPPRSPNPMPYIERFVRSIKEECLPRTAASAEVGACGQTQILAAASFHARRHFFSIRRRPPMPASVSNPAQSGPGQRDSRRRTNLLVISVDALRPVYRHALVEHALLQVCSPAWEIRPASLAGMRPSAQRHDDVQFVEYVVGIPIAFLPRGRLAGAIARGHEHLDKIAAGRKIARQCLHHRRRVPRCCRGATHCHGAIGSTTSPDHTPRAVSRRRGSGPLRQGNSTCHRWSDQNSSTAAWHPPLLIRSERNRC